MRDLGEMLGSLAGLGMLATSPFLPALLTADAARANAVRTLGGCAVWLGAAGVSALTRQLTLLWVGSLLGLTVRAVGRLDPAPRPSRQRLTRPVVLPWHRPAGDLHDGVPRAHQHKSRRAELSR